MSIVTRFIIWGIRRAKRHPNTVVPMPVVTFGNSFLFNRYEFFRLDEYKYGNTLHNALPWYCPVNAFLHHWKPAALLFEPMHDHPRWSITVCLRGAIIERTPWGQRLLTPGSIVIRSRKAIHSFEVPAKFSGKTWTLFIVGRRKHRQNTYQVTPR